MGRRLSFLRRVRTVLVATNRRTDNSIIADCNIVKPMTRDNGSNILEKNKFTRKKEYKGKVSYNRTTEDRRK